MEPGQNFVKLHLKVGLLEVDVGLSLYIEIEEILVNLSGDLRNLNLQLLE